MQAHFHVTTDDPSVRARRDEVGADFEAIYRKFQPRLKRFLRSRINDPDLTDDLVHETLVRAIAAGDRFDPSRPVWPWLRTIAANVATDSLRRSASAREELCGDISDSGRADPDSAEERALLEQALRGLPGRDRAALSLCYLDDWKHTEAAAFLGLTRPGFDKLLSRARRRLRVEYSRIDSSLRGLLALPAIQFRALTLRLRRAQSSGELLPPSIIEPVSHAMAALALLLSSGTAVAPREPAPMESPPLAFVNDQRPADAPADASAAETATSPPGGEDPPTSRGNDRPAPSGAGSGGGDPVGDFTDPNRTVRDPEDAQIGSMAFGRSDGSLIYAAGTTHCRVPACPPVLFRSTDGGSSWGRLPAKGLNGTDIVIPPGHRRHHKIFAMGAGGLQVSNNSGLSFEPVVAGGAPIATGSMAVSPAFDEGDPTVLVGAQTLLQYRDSTGAFDPYPAAMHGPFDPAFSPNYIEDHLFFLGALRNDGIHGMRARVSICNPQGCIHKGLPVRGQPPKVRVLDGPTLLAFTEDAMFMAHDPEADYSRMAFPWQGSSLLDVAPAAEGDVLVAAVASPSASRLNGVYVSGDMGGSWTRARGSLLRSGAVRIAARGHRVVVALPAAGLACSNDGGRTFARRCKA